VEIGYKKNLKRPVTLAEVKADKKLSNMYLVRAARLSVQSVTKEEFDMVMAMSEA
jgi:predicted RNA-binding protein with PUA-like domain